MRPKIPSSIISLFLLVAAQIAQAATGTDTWTGAAGTANWSDALNWSGVNTPPLAGDTPAFGTVGGGGATLNMNLTSPNTNFLGLTFNANAPSFVLNGGTINSTGGLVDNSTNLQTVNLNVIFTSSHSLNAVSGGTMLIGGVISGAGGTTKTGGGTVTLTNANTYTGATTINQGNLNLDFTLGSPAANIVSSSSALALGGGTLNIIGNASAASSQTFASVTLNPGLNIINAAPVSGANIPTVTLGGWTANRGALVRFIGPATIGAANIAVPATATIKTTTVGSGATGGIFLGEGPAVANPTAAYATVGLYDWASTSLAGGTAGTSPYTIIGGSQVAGFYNTAWGFNNVDVTSSLAAMVNNSVACSVRFNDPTASSLATGGGGNLLFYGVLVTPNMGAVNASFTGGGTWQITRISSPNGAQTGAIWQNNTLGYLIMTPVIADGRDGASDPVQVAKGGDGTVTLASGSGYTGTTYLNGGNVLITANSSLGAIATGTTVQLNGGAIVGDGGSFALDNAGTTPKRGIALLSNGGGLAATASNTMTVDGVVSGGSPLVIGIGASSANGNVPGLLPGSGSIANGQTVDTANTTPVFATGTVELSGANTYTGGTVLQNGTLRISGATSLGTGGLTFNGGTFQWNGVTTDISAQSVSILAGGATLDVNGSTVTLANSIGQGGSGAVTVKNSGVGGGLFLNGGTTYAGNTTVNSGGTLGGTGTVAGNVTWSSGAKASLTQGSPMTVSGTATFNNNTVTVNVPGAALTDSGSPYTLMTSTAGIAGGSTVASVPVMTGSGLASGYNGAVLISGNSIILTVTAAGVIGTWTDGNATENWSEAGNWSGGVPHLAGSSAIFNSAGGSAVTLDANETVGSITLNNPSSDVITGSGTALTMDNSGFGASVSVSDGAANVIAATVALKENTMVTVGSGKSVTFSNIVSNTASAKTLVVNGAGTTVLSAANTYGPASGSTGTTLSGGGVLQVGNNAALGAGDLTVTANSTLKAGAAGLSLANNITVNNLITATVDDGGNNLSLAGVIGGGGTLTKNNTGTLTLGSANTYSGGTVINNGTIGIASAGTTPGNPGSLGTVPVSTTPNNIILNGGDLLATGSFALNTNRGIGIGPVSGTAPATALVDVAAGQTFNIAGVMASAGNTGANGLTVNSGSGHTGTLVLSGANTLKGTTTVSNGVLQLANTLALQNSTLNYNSGALLFDSSLTATTLGGLSGTNATGIGLTNLSGAAVTLTVGNNNSSTAYYGGLSGSGVLAKVGTGTLTMSNATYSGGTIVYAGGLNIVAPNSSSGHLDISAQFGGANVSINGASLTSANGLYITSPTGSTGTIFGNAASLIITNGAQVTASADGGGRALSYGAGNGRPGGNGSLTVGTAGGTTTLVTVNGALDMFYTSGGGTVGNFAVNLNGGTLAVNNIQESTYGNQSGTFNFNGGILKALAGDGAASFFPSTPSQLTAVVNAGGAIINPNGHGITIANTLTHGTGTPDGGLTVFGGGMLTLTAANSYTGITTVSNAVLSINNTAGSGTGNNVVNVLTNGYLGGSGTISGNVTINNYGHTLPGGTNGNVVGVTTTVSNLTFAAGSEADFNLGNVYYYGNDQIVVNGSLAGNGVSIGISATDIVATNLDTTGDYVLFHVIGTYVSGFNLFPVWLGATPTNAAYFSIVYNGSDVVLHYSPIILTSKTASPNPATRNQVVTFTVDASSGSGIDPGTGIYVDASPLGGPSTFYLVQSNGTSVYTNSLAVANGTALGTANLPLTISDNGSNVRNDFIPLTINSFSEVWNGLGSDNQWATGANWDSGLPPAYGDALTFAGATQLAANMESSYSVGAVTFTNGAGALNITNDANTLTLLGHGVTNLSSSAQTLSVPVYLTATPTFNAAAGNILLNDPVSGDGQGVIFTGTNMTTLAGINTYNGNTVISAGTLVITGAGQLGSGYYAGNITDNGTLSYNSSADQTLSGNVSGAGSLVHNGSSTLTLSGANAAYTGAITVNKNSTLLAGANVSLGTGTTTLMGGTLGASVDGLSLNGSKLSVPSGTNGLVNMTSKMRLPALYGSGTLNINVNNANPVSASQPGDSFSACANFTGTLNVTGQVANAQMNCYFNGGSFDGLLQNATVNLITGAGGGVSLVGVNNSGGNTAQIGTLNVDAASSLGGAVYAGTQTYQIGALGGLSDIEGAITGFSVLIKVGNGTLLLNNGGNTYTGNTTVSAGTLLVNGQITASPVTVNSGAKLSGVGIIGGSTTNKAGAVLAAGVNGIGTLTFNTNLTLNGLSTNLFVVTTPGGASNHVAVASGTLTPNSSLIQINTAGNAVLGAGTNVLFTYNSIAGSFTATPVFVTPQTGIATNAFILDTGSQITLVVTNLPNIVNTNPTNITAVVAGNTLSLTWPGDHLGWTLQTNSVDLANTNYWFPYPGSASVTNVNITINPAQPKVFFRLAYP